MSPSWMLSTWAFIIVCQMMFRRAVRRGELEAVAFRLPFLLIPLGRRLPSCWACWC